MGFARAVSAEPVSINTGFSTGFPNKQQAARPVSSSMPKISASDATESARGESAGGGGGGLSRSGGGGGLA
jgi:hypothetical protein